MRSQLLELRSYGSWRRNAEEPLLTSENGVIELSEEEFEHGFSAVMEFRHPGARPGPEDDRFGAISVPTEGALRDVGELRLIHRDRRDYLNTLTDEALIAFLDGHPGGRGRRIATPLRHAALREMAGRGGERCRKRLQSLAVLEEEFAAQLLLAEREGTGPALRIEIDGMDSSEVHAFEYPHFPQFTGTLHNLSIQGIAHLGLGSAHLVPMVRDSTRTELDRESMITTGTHTVQALPPGSSVAFGFVPLHFYAQFPALGPGAFDVRLFYQPDLPLSDYAVVGDLVGFTTPSYSVLLSPRRIELSRTEAEQLARWVEEIDVTRPIPLCRHPWSESLEFMGKPPSPEDAIYRSGFVALPVLIDALEQSHESGRRNWIVALLYNLTQLHWPGYLVRHEDLAHWPTVEASTVAPRPSSWWTFNRMDDLVDAWLADRRWLEVTWVE